MFSFFRFGSVSAGSQIIIHTEDYASIQQAIDNASVGATVLVSPGIYYEHLSIGKSISLLGASRETTIIDAADSQNVISITSDGVTIGSLTLVKSSARTSDNGIYVDRSRGIVVNDTKIVGTYNGIYMYLCLNSIFSHNIIANQTSAVTLITSNRNVFSNNIISNNSNGITISYSNNNVFSGNTLSNNEQGISISEPSDRNNFYHNNIGDAVILSGATPNIWSRSGEGNYWLAYNFTGRDMNGDGIGDEPFVIDESNKDSFPLMGTFSEFDVDFGNSTYNMNVISNSTISNFRFETGRETGSKMITFTASSQNGVGGFCRIMVPTSLMNYTFTVIDNEGEVPFSLLPPSNATNAYLYFTYAQGDQGITIVSLKFTQFYNDLLLKFFKLQADLDSLNITYQNLLTNYNATMQTLLNNFNLLFVEFTQLQNTISALNSTLQNNSRDQSNSLQNMRNLAYILAATTVAFLMIAVYFSARLHTTRKPRTRGTEELE
jgi:parallel beta-helix repeat protein